MNCNCNCDDIVCDSIRCGNCCEIMKKPAITCQYPGGEYEVSRYALLIPIFAYINYELITELNILMYDFNKCTNWWF